MVIALRRVFGDQAVCSALRFCCGSESAESGQLSSEFSENHVQHAV